jgi:hypothetical protein
VFLQLHGDAACSPPFELGEGQAIQDSRTGTTQAAVLFQRGSVDAFRLRLPALGRLQLAGVWLDGKGSPWHLELLVVTAPDGEGCCTASCCQSHRYAAA